MKKNIISLLLVICSFMFFTGVKADTIDCQNSDACVKLCDYSGEGTIITNFTTYQDNFNTSINFYYKEFKSEYSSNTIEQYDVGYFKPVYTNTTSAYGKPSEESIESAMMETGSSFYKTGNCPTYSQIADESTGMCFDNNNSNCANKLKGTIITGNLVYDYGTEVTQILNSLPVPSCDDIVGSDDSFSPVNDAINVGLSNLFHVDKENIPDFVTKSKAWGDGSTAYKNKAGAIVAACKTQIIADSSLSEEDKQQKLDNIEAFNNSINNLGTEVFTGKYGGVTVGNDCDGLLGTGEFRDFLQHAFDLIKVIGPVLALVLGMIDFLKATASGEEDAKKKAVKDVKGRLIAAVLLYLLPVILEFILSLVPGFDGTCDIH